MPPNLGNNRRPERDVRHKVPVPAISSANQAQLRQGKLGGTGIRDKEAKEERREGGKRYIMSTCSQSAPWSMVAAHSSPNRAKSADRIEGAMMAGGVIFAAAAAPVYTF